MDECWVQCIGVCSCLLLREHPLVHVPACPCWGHSTVGLHRPSWWAIVTHFNLYCSSPFARAEFPLSCTQKTCAVPSACLLPCPLYPMVVLSSSTMQKSPLGGLKWGRWPGQISSAGSLGFTGHNNTGTASGGTAHMPRCRHLYPGSSVGMAKVINSVVHFWWAQQKANNKDCSLLSLLSGSGECQFPSKQQSFPSKSQHFSGSAIVLSCTWACWQMFLRAITATKWECCTKVSEQCSWSEARLPCLLPWTLLGTSAL